MPDRRNFIKQSSLAGAALFLAGTLFNELYGNMAYNENGIGSLRYCQVHLDFHNSEFFEDMACDFNPEEFATTLKKQMSLKLKVDFNSALKLKL